MTLKKCPSCGHQHDSADIVCPYCKYSYSEKKYICNNCGAYLQPADKLCYVCGQVVEGQVMEVAEPPVVEEEKAQPVYEQTVEDIAKRAAQGEIVHNEPEITFQDEPKEKPKKSKSKKVAIVCTIIVVIVALLAGGVCFCHYNGLLDFNQVPTEPVERNITIYFEKPMSNQNLMTADGTVYNWTGDVDVNYILDGKETTETCKMTEEYDSIWYAEIPESATDVYFSESSLEIVRTAVVQPEDGYIYYVTDILFNNNVQLPVESCALNDFDSFGINYYQVETQAPTETTAENSSAQEETEAVTESTTQDYNIVIPEQWNENLTVIEKENCTSYYERYNYNNYACGLLLSVYVVDSNDTSYSEMNVQKVVTTSDGTKKIVVVTPTDIQFYDGDDTAFENYNSMSSYVTQVIDSITAN